MRVLLKKMGIASAMIAILSAYPIEALAKLDHGQGEMAGMVGETSVVLQSRLTDGRQLVDGDLPGSRGVARFEISTNKNFATKQCTPWIEAVPENDYIVKTCVKGLKPATQYYYRLAFGATADGDISRGRTCYFRTLGGKADAREVKLVVVTGMNYAFFHGKEKGYKGPDKLLGYPALRTILKKKPDFFIGTGDNVYFDHPGGKLSCKTQPELRRKYHEQFYQPRFVDLFAQVPTFWEKDDHDHRYNDCDLTGDREPSSELGIATFLEQMPVADPADPSPVTYSTHRLSRDLQIWLVEGRDYRSPNKMEDGPEKTLWGARQIRWLKRTLLASDATFKILISPTPLVGPDDAYKTDNHVNHKGFRHEGEAFLGWLKENGFLEKNFYLACGDRHWQYHAIHPSGFEEFSTGALVDANSRKGRLAGDEKSTDPDALIEQPYCMFDEPSGGFLSITVSPGKDASKSIARFEFFDENGKALYSTRKKAQ